MNFLRETRQVGSLLQRVLVALTAALPMQALAQENPPLSKFSQRYDGFRLLFNDRKLELGSLEAFRADRNKSNWIVVALGPEGDALELLAEPDRYLVSGVSILVASDTSLIGPGDFPASFQSGSVIVRAGDQAYQGKPECPVIRDFKPDSPLFASVEALALNRPGWLVPQRATATVLARFPKDALFDGSPLRESPAAIVAGQIGAGRFLLVADQSVFVNEMLLELDNVRFASNVVDWLAEGKPVNVKVLFLEGATPAQAWVDEAFQKGDWTEPPPLETLIALANEMVAGLQEEDVFNKMALAEQDRLSPEAVQMARIFIPAGLLLLFLGWRLHKGHARKAPVESKGLGESLGLSPLEERRQQALASGNLVESGAHIAKDFFEEALPGENWRDRAPKVRGTGRLWKQWKDQRELRWIWRLATGRTDHLKRRGFLRLQAAVLRWQAALQNGQRRLEVVMLVKVAKRQQREDSTMERAQFR